jgi:transcriptional regulator with XRE-family HTH domain
MKDETQFGRRLMQLRKEKGFVSALQLSKAAGVVPSHISTIERGEVIPRWATAEKIADALRLSQSERSEFYHRIELARRTPGIAEILGGAGLDESAEADGGAVRAMGATSMIGRQQASQTLRPGRRGDE